MRILHCIYDHIRNPWVGGGGAARVYEICRRLSARHEITVVCGAYPGAEDYTDEGVSYRFFGTRRDNYLMSTLCYAVRAARFVRRFAGEFDIVIEDFAPYNPLFSFLWNRDAVIQLHQREGMGHFKKYLLLGIPFYLIEKFYPRFFVGAVAESEIGRRLYGLGEECRVIPNGFDPHLLALQPGEKGYVLFLGRLHIDQKGLDTLRGASDMSDFRLIIAGGGKDETKARDLFCDGVKRGKVEFAGYVRGSEKEDLLRNSLYVVVPSRYEGQPVTVVEAAACGKAVVVSDIPELRYAVDAGFGISFRTGDAGDLAGKMEMLLGNASLRREMGRRGREYSRQFTWDRIAEEHERYLLGLRRGAAEEQ